jgi:hypothetical protein
MAITCDRAVARRRHEAFGGRFPPFFLLRNSVRGPRRRPRLGRRRRRLGAWDPVSPAGRAGCLASWARSRRCFPSSCCGRAGPRRLPLACRRLRWPRSRRAGARRAGGDVAASPPAGLASAAGARDGCSFWAGGGAAPRGATTVTSLAGASTGPDPSTRTVTVRFKTLTPVTFPVHCSHSTKHPTRGSVARTAPYHSFS